MQVAIHELKAGLSKYLAQARAGEVIEVTSHNKPVARLVGIPQAEVPGLARLMARGAVQWSGEKPSLQPAVELTADGKTLGELIAEERA